MSPTQKVVAAVLVGLAALVITLIAMETSEPGSSTTGDTRPGSPAVYDEIATTTDCGELQAGFDRNMDDAEQREPGDPLRDVVLSYAEAYDAQLEAAGCYG